MSFPAFLHTSVSQLQAFPRLLNHDCFLSVLLQYFWLSGDCWYHIPSPQKQKLKQVSVGRTSVFVLDKNGKDLKDLYQ